ncbi:threonylcarbamoyl-AMP synthase [Solemya velum gill symbiont]|uniref:L-threonylcarbamoyladenylate synthase n=1 Tax=Solemya velum gill symbiont TaxID=2340 RepID=UPI000996A165|nr:L-threonylcarbamoyladenylate synthase [Solemya velum gill symbiont]OOZ18781.1 threonylcarbamoyl-AMP synthase [Solemya velum gill symbiont]OOZ28280.1 threonylcarbamoyl-AMP synthase [Solemya velum gill symbiont]
MSQFFQIHPDNPQARLISQAVEIVRNGGVVIYPTDSAYALGCHLEDKEAMERIVQIRRVGKDHNFTLVCRDLSEIATYAKVSNASYRTLKSLIPGPYTFIFCATKEVPKRLLNPKRKTIGIRVPDNRIALDLLESLGEPLMSTTLILPGEEDPLTDPYDMRQTLEYAVDLIIDGGYCGIDATTVVHMDEDPPRVSRAGLGDTSMFEAG